MSSVLTLGITLICTATTIYASELHDAVRAHDKAAVEEILAGGAPVDETDFIIGTPLHVAVSGGNWEIGKILIDHGADVEAVSEQQGARPVHFGAQFGDVSMLALLIDSYGHLAVAKLLLEHGADVSATTSTGQTPFWLAVFPQSYTAVGDASLLEYLLAQGADPNAKDDSGLSALAYADFQVRQGAVVFAEIADELRRLGATE